nr:metal-dependent hydrolase [Thermococcus sp. MV11]
MSGVLSYPVAVALAGLLADHGAPLELSTMALIIGYAFYVLGSDLPDMDHPNALIHRGTKPIVSVAAGGAVYTNIAGSIDLGQPWLNTAVEWVVAALAGVMAWFAFTWLMPRHRGIVHSLLFAAIYGGLAFLMVEYGLGMRTGEGLFVGLSAFLGYTLHLLLDGSVKLV